MPTDTPAPTRKTHTLEQAQARIAELQSLYMDERRSEALTRITDEIGALARVVAAHKITSLAAWCREVSDSLGLCPPTLHDASGVWIECHAPDGLRPRDLETTDKGTADSPRAERPSGEVFAVGDRVRTTADAGSTDWTPAMRTPKWGVAGKVFAVSRGHGLCYGVAHEDGTSSWYEAGEVEPAARTRCTEEAGHGAHRCVLFEHSPARPCVWDFEVAPEPEPIPANSILRTLGRRDAWARVAADAGITGEPTDDQCDVMALRVVLEPHVEGTLADLLDACGVPGSYGGANSRGLPQRVVMALERLANLHAAGPDPTPRDRDDAGTIDKRWRQWARRYLPADQCTTSDAMRDVLGSVLDAVRQQGRDLDAWRRWTEHVLGSTGTDEDMRASLFARMESAK